MRTERLDAFSDGVMAILITIMVLEFRVPHGAAIAVLRPCYTSSRFRRRSSVRGSPGRST